MDIFDVKLDKYTKFQLRKKLEVCLSGDHKIKISKINTEFLSRAYDNSDFLNVLNKSDLNIVDGRGVLWAARYLTLPISNNGFIRRLQAIWQFIYATLSIVFYPKFITKPIAETIPGVEAFDLMMQVASDARAGVFLFGSSQKTLDLAVKNIEKKFPKLKISGKLNGYDYQKDSSIDVISQIDKTDAKVLIVALGSPKQEYWINENMGKLKSIQIAVGEGGTLDRIANPGQKAPKFVNKIGLEWLWRALFNKSKTESRNGFQRFWRSVPLFMYRTVKWKVKYGQTKI